MTMLLNNKPTSFALALWLISMAASAAQAQDATKTPSANGQLADAATMRQLSEAQLRAIKAIRRESEKRAAPLALRVASATKHIYGNMLADKEDQALRRKLSAQMNQAVVALLAIKGQSIRDVIAVLTPAQKQLVKSEMRKPGAPGDLTELMARVFSLPDK